MLLDAKDFFRALAFEGFEDLRDLLGPDSVDEKTRSKRLPVALDSPLILLAKVGEQRQLLEIVQISNEAALFFGEPNLG